MILLLLGNRPVRGLAGEGGPTLLPEGLDGTLTQRDHRVLYYDHERKYLFALHFCVGRFDPKELRCTD